MRELRRLVGPRPLVMVGAAALVFDDLGRLLMDLRRDNGTWGLPGGGLEPGETLEDTARRELFEETGLVAKELRLFEVFSGPGMHYVYPNGDEVHNVSAVFVARRWSGEPRPQAAENRALRFFDLGHLPEAISPPVRPVIARVLDRRAELLRDLG